jgi:hypothetical protein
MKNHGWTISVIEYVEESNFDRSFSNIEDNNYRYDNDSGGDDYDIDDNSDFWRRAGD